MNDFFDARITHIYLIYGLGFFTLGLAVALEVGRTSDSRFAQAMRPLAAFGLIHGTHEWVEMFELVGTAAYNFVAPPWWQWSRLAMLAISFVALAIFGVQMLYTSPSRPAAGFWGGMGMLTLYAAGVLALGMQNQEKGSEWLKAAEAWTRYSLGVPGALLAAAGLRAEWRSLRQAELAPFANNFLWAAIVFLLYGLVGQTISPHSVLFPSNYLNTEAFRSWSGFPIQVLRGIFAALMAIFIIRGLRAFEVDRQRKLATAQKEAQEAMSRRDALRGELLRHTVAAQEDERARLARELHDDTLQVLTGLSAGLKGTEQVLESSPEKAKIQLSYLTKMTSHAIEELRRLILDLRPSMLDDMGLVSAVQWYIEALDERLGASVEVMTEGLDCRLPAPVETILFRIVQEGLNNIARHAQADRVAVRLRCDRVTTRLEIEDNGIGFDPAATLQIPPTRPGWGLVGIQERVALAGGEFEIESAPGHGTILRVAVPATLSGTKADQG